MFIRLNRDNSGQGHPTPIYINIRSIHALWPEGKGCRVQIGDATSKAILVTESFDQVTAQIDSEIAYSKFPPD